MARNAPPRPKRQLAQAARPTAMQAAQSEIDPIIAAITGAATQKAAAAEAAIKGYTDSYAHQLSGMDAGAPYQGAEQQQAAVDAALRGSLAGGGTDLASQLASRLAALQGSSGAAALGQEGQALAGQGAAAGNTELAQGSAALENLIGRHAAASSFSRKLPGLAKLSGLQGLKQAEGNAQQEIAQGTLSTEGELPNIVQQIRSSRQAQAALKAENAYRGAELAQGQQRIGIEGFNAKTSRFRANVSAQQGAQRLQISAQSLAQRTLSQNRSYRVSLANLGVSQKNAQLKWMTAQAKLQGGGYTPNELHGMQVQANAIASDASKHGASLQQVMHTMQLNDIPPSVAQKAAKLAGIPSGKPIKFFFPNILGPVGKGGKGFGFLNSGKVDTTHAGGFLPPGLKYTYDRHDQGRDIQTRVGAPILAPGDGYVVRVASDPGGGGGHFGPAYPIVFFTSGPYKGHYVYIGHTVSALRAGARFKAGHVLSRTQRSGAHNGGAPDGWAEIGFAPGGSPGGMGQPAPF